ncbi:hypothetical protein GOP47_0005750, partial [Adiantum capillus-veneris]
QFLTCLHPRIKEKGECGDAKDYAQMVFLAKVKSKKAKRKLEMGLLDPTDYGYSSTMELFHAMKPKGISSVKEVVASSLVSHFGSSFQFVPPICCAVVQESISSASKDAVLAKVCMHEEANEDVKSSRDKLEVVGKAMVKAVQEEANQGVGQPCPTDRVEVWQCISEGIGHVDVPENEVINGFFSRLANDMVIEEVLEEQAKVVEQSDLLSPEVVEDEVSKAMADEDLHGESGIECMPFEGPTIEGMLEKQVVLVLQEEAPLKDRLPKVCAMLLMVMLLKLLCRQLCTVFWEKIMLWRAL